MTDAPAAAHADATAGLDPVAATLAVADAADRAWDAVVVGAGPAGSLAALWLARAGRDVLLVDKAAFPRGKVCGGCLNHGALQTLATAGLGDLCERAGAPATDHVKWQTPNGAATLALAPGVAISRERFDAELVGAAIRHGAHFLPRTSATATTMSADGAARVVTLTHDGTARDLRAALVLVADGLGGRLLRRADDPDDLQVADHSRVGLGTVAPPGTRFAFDRPGEIHMAWTRDGYVGVARLEGDRLDIAAAVNHGFLRACDGPADAVARILDRAGSPPVQTADGADALPELAWRGTDRLTRRRTRVAQERLFVLGDATGYVEPFTGEGMAWALASATLVAPLALEAIRDGWRPHLARRWVHQHRTHIRRRQAGCRAVAALLRRPWLVVATVRLGRLAPWLVTAVARRLHRPIRLPAPPVPVVSPETGGSAAASSATHTSASSAPAVASRKGSPWE